MMQISVHTIVDKQLGHLVQALKFRDSMKKSVELLAKEAQQNFEQQGRIYGLWRPLAMSTRKQRARLGLGARPILNVTGKLKRGFKTSSWEDKAEIRNIVSYAKYHQFGTKRIPKRRILDTSDKSRKAIGLIFANFINEQIRKFL